MSGWTPIGLRRRAAFLYLGVVMVEIIVEIMVDFMVIMVVIDKNDCLVEVLVVMAVIIMIKGR